MPASSLPGLVSLVIATSGHRDLDSDPVHITAICTTLRDFLTRQAHRYPNTPILLLSGMAEGADQLAVEVVRSLADPRINYQPVLCMPEEAFLLDLSAEGRTLFKEQVAGKTIIELPIHPSYTLNDLRHKKKEARAQQFSQLAEFLAKSSQILVAIWENVSVDEHGLPIKSKAGGTAEVVARKLGHHKPDLLQSEGHLPFTSPVSVGVLPFGTGPVFHIAAQRQSVTHHEPALATNLLLPLDTTPEDFEKIYLLLDEYNRDVLTHQQLKKKAESKARSLTGGVATINLTPAMLWCCEVRSWCAALSEHYQAVNKRLIRILFAFVLLLGLSLHLIEWLSEAAGWPLYIATTVVYASAASILLLLGIENGYFAWSIRRIRRVVLRRRKPELELPRLGLKLRRKHEDYRALAEALRVQFYWLAAGVDAMAADSYMDRYAGDMIWIREATSEAFIALYENTGDSAASEFFSMDLAKRWLDGQFSYFDKAPEDLEPIKRRINVLAWFLAIPTFVCPLGLLWLSRYAPEAKVLRTDITLLTSLLLLCAVVAWNYAETSGYEQTIQQARQMCRFYASARSRLKSLLESRRDAETCTDSFAATNRQQTRELLGRIGKEALAENGEWLSMHRGRDFKLNRTAG